MSNVIKIRKGYDIRLKGKADRVIGTTPATNHFSIHPTDFKGITPKLEVKAGQQILAGDVLFHNKIDERIKFCSPVSGEVAEIVRGEKRKILAIRILADKEQRYRDFGQADVNALDRAQIVDKMLQSGVWSLVEMRPYGVVANPSHEPKSIFVNAMATAPLATNVDFALEGLEKEFQSGLNVLRKLTAGKVHLVSGVGSKAAAIAQAQGVEKHTFSGPHPSGNTSVHIHNIDPLNKGEVIWTMNAQDVVVLGRLFTEGRFDATRVVALSGSRVKAPKHYKLLPGASLKALFAEAVESGDNRYISGNVLTGAAIGAEGYLGYYSKELTVIPEGHYTEFLGWVLPGFGKFSVSKTFTSWLTPNKEYDLDTNMHGEERAFVVTGQYEKVFPFDIYPQQLLKSILVNDIEKMENLGIYEVVEEDFALCEVICTSKLELQQIVREGLNGLYVEMN